MHATIPVQEMIALLGPDESSIMVRLVPSSLSNECLQAIRKVCEPREGADNVFRAWLRDCTLRESGRRLASLDDSQDVPVEAEAWLLPWHRWTDKDLREALTASYSWASMRLPEEDRAAFDAIHMAVVTVVATRLHELHTAIEQAQRNEG